MNGPRIRTLYLNHNTREYIAQDTTGEYFVGILDQPVRPLGQLGPRITMIEVKSTLWILAAILFWMGVAVTAKWFAEALWNL